MIAAATFGAFFASAASPFDALPPFFGGLPLLLPYVPLPAGIIKTPNCLIVLVFE